MEYLLDFMAPEMLGWCTFDQMGGAHPLSFSEIHHFSMVTDMDLDPWEARQLREMSASYVSGLSLGSGTMIVSPAYENSPEDDPGIQYERERISATIKAGFSALKGAS